MLNINQLHQALSQLNTLAKFETTFDVEGVPITLRPLTTTQEMEVQKYAAAILIGDEEEREAMAMEYIERFKVACLSHSIIAIGDLYMGDEEFIETEEKTKTGRSVKIPRHEAVFDVISQWARPTLTNLFRKFGEMIEKMEIAVENAIEFDPPDLDIEIDRLKQRVKDLEQLKLRRNVSQSEVEEKRSENNFESVEAEENDFIQKNNQEEKELQTSKNIDKTSRTNVNDRTHARTVVSERNQDIEMSHEKPTQNLGVQERKSVIPNQVPPPVRANRPVETQESSQEKQEKQESVEEEKYDPTSPEALQAEHRRMMEMRNKRAPHMAARNVSHQMRPQQTQQKPVQEGVMNVGGEEVPVFRMPKQNLSGRPQQTQQKSSEEKKDPTINPNYRPRKRR